MHARDRSGRVELHLKQAVKIGADFVGPEGQMQIPNILALGRMQNYYFVRLVPSRIFVSYV